MNIISASGKTLFSLHHGRPGDLCKPVRFAEYTVLLFPEGTGVYHADFGAFPFEGPVLLFATPTQVIHIQQEVPTPFVMIRFHGDFYCIEYHRSEVACNGLLFNNIYIEPSVILTTEETDSFRQIILQLEGELSRPAPAEIVLRAYLQLFLAKCSAVKTNTPANTTSGQPKDDAMEQFRTLLETHYLTLHKPSDYAELMAMAPNTFTKRCTRYFHKTPSQLIQERLILEAKKQLHLTRKSIKEIAHALKFEDEYYFSRVFKKFTNTSPQTFRDSVGISVVADLSS